MKVRRSKYVSYFIVDGHLPDYSKLLAGRAELESAVRIVAMSALTESELVLDKTTFSALVSIPSRGWKDATELTGLPLDKVAFLAKSGLVITDLTDSWATALRKKEERLFEVGWHARAATFYFLSKWRGVRLFREIDLEDSDPYLTAMRELADDYAQLPEDVIKRSPPEDWEHHDVQEKVVLPDVYLNPHTKFLDVLFSRVSERRFGNNPIPLQLLATILACAFRPTGYYPSDFYNAYHKTSPSGGGLHPTEAFILVRSVEDLRAGLYHYYARRHELHLIRELDQDYARDKLVSYAAGQPYTMHAGAGIILTQRFDRHYWKYYRNDRAALVLSMDVGALAQTLYLTSTYVGLPGFFTGAINAGDIEDDLDLHGPEHGATALFLLGTPHANPSSEATLVIEKSAWWKRNHE